MIGSKLIAMVVLLAGIAGSTLAQAQTPAALIYDPAVGSINFAAGDLKAALQQNGYSVTDLPIGDPSAATQSVRIILTTSDVSVPGKPSGHPLAAGLPAEIQTVAIVAGDFSWGEPGGSPIIIARLNNGSDHPCVYAYEKAAAMTSGTAPARRVHLFLQNDTFASLTADGLALFDAAVRWATGRDLAARFEPPTLHDGQLRLQWVGGGTLQTATNMPGPWSDVSGGASPFLANTTNPAQFFRVKQWKRLIRHGAKTDLTNIRTDQK